MLSYPSRKVLSERLSGLRRKSWYETASIPDKVRIDSASSKDSAAWLLALPRTPYLTVEASIFRTMICHRLGADIPGITQVKCRCNTRNRSGWIDSKGIHLMAQCPRGNQRFNTHDALVLNYAQMLREAGFLTRMEPRNEFIHIDGTGKRPDLQVYNFKGGRACFDVSVTHPALLRHGLSTAPEAGKAAGKREQEKFSKYKDIATAAGMTFHPLVHEAHGRVGISAQRVLKTCVEKIALLRRQPVASVIHYWRSRLSLALQISQARAVHERFRDSQVAHNAGSDESSWLNYRGIAWSR
jgi:hypothetical protein